MGQILQIELSEDARQAMRRIEIEDGIPPGRQLSVGLTLLQIYLSAQYQGKRMVVEDHHGREKDVVQIPDER